MCLHREETMTNIDEMSINAIRVLSADAIQKANSGHPGLPLGTAPTAYELWTNHMNYNPADPKWENRDRFVLSGGHGSMLLYSLFHLLGIGNLSLDDVKNFRQMGSKTPGHPEYGHTVGVEATTGPLGQGMAMAVGMAMAEAHLASVFNKDGYNVVDHYTYVLGGDGCMMEGISSECFSLAGTLGLSKLIVFYDSNNISIEGSTDIAFTENVMKRFEAFGFQTIEVADGNDIEAIGKAIEEAKADKERPSLIKVNTLIGYGCPAKQGKASAHGEPLGIDNVAALKENLNWPCKGDFEVPQEVYDHYKEIAARMAEPEKEWNKLFAEYCEKFPEMKERTVIVNGVSKAYAMTGWRIGFIAGPEWLVKACNKLQGQYTSGPCSVSQKAAEAAYTGSQAPVEEMRKAFERRRDLIVRLAKEVPGFEVNVPEGAFYLFPKCDYFFGKSDGERTIADSDDLAMYLLEGAHVACVGGASFGAPECIRMSYATSDENIVESIRRIKEALAKLK